MLYLNAGIDWADRRQRGSRFERAKIGDDELRTVEQVEGNFISLLDSQLMEGCRKPVYFLPQLSEAYLITVEDHRSSAGVFVGYLIKYLRQRALWNFNVCRNSFRIEL
ncbi:hypothetical protein ES703_109231 [subsurface metagenome]